jgi:hypothetical protein
MTALAETAMPRRSVSRRSAGCSAQPKLLDAVLDSSATIDHERWITE